MTRHARAASAFLLLFLLASGRASGQDYRRYAPQEPSVPAAPAALPRPPLHAEGQDTVLLPSLRGVVFVSSPEKAAAVGRNEEGVRAEGLPLLEGEGGRTVAAPYLGKPASLRTLDALANDVVLYYRDHDRPVVDVSIPEQDISGGVVQVVVVEGKVGAVRARGNRWFSGGAISDGIRLDPGGSIRASRLLDDLDWLNRNPFRSSTAVFSPGKLEGTTDVAIQTRDRFPLRGYAGYDDGGNALTGYDRWYAGVNWGDAFFAGQQLNYQFTASSNVDGLVAHSASYVVPLPWRHLLTLYGAVSTSHVIEPGFDLRGGGVQAGLRYEVPLPAWRGRGAAGPSYTQSVYGGYDWKQSNNFLEFGVVPAANTTTDVGEFVAGYRGNETDAWGESFLNAEADVSPVQGGGLQGDAAYQTARAGARARYAYFKGELGRTVRLPGDVELANTARGQYATENLLPSEQMLFGGEDSARGYDDQDLTGTDDGWLLRTELRSPPLSASAFFAPKFGQNIADDRLQFLVFHDWGQAWMHRGELTLNDGRAAGAATFESVGPGLRYTVGSYLSVRADYGFQLHDTGDASAARWHLAVMLSY